MLRWIVGSSLRLVALAVAFAGVILLLGITQLRSAAVDTYPEFTAPSVQVQTEALGLSAAEVEALITVPLENELNGVAWVDHIQSSSVPALSSVVLTFKRGTDIYRARQLVTERLAQGPGVAKVGSPSIMIQPVSSNSRVMMIALSAKDTSLMEMSILARWKIQPKLMGVPGVANVSIWGERARQLQIQVDPARLKRNGISLSKVIDTAGNALWSSPLTFVEASTPGADGFVDTPEQRLGIQHILPINTAKDLASVTFEDTGGKTLHVGDVSTVTEDHQPLIGDAVLKNGPGLILVVQKSPGANTLQVTKDLEAAMNALKPGMSGITVDTRLYRPATFIDTALHNVGLGALIGLLLVIVALSLLLYSWRLALIGTVSIAVSLVSAAYVLFLCGVTFNTMVLAGLVVAVAAVIDDAVGDAVIFKRRFREYRESGSTGSLASVVQEAALESRGPLIYATVAILLALLPIFMLTGVAGAFAKPFVIAYAVALGTSMVVALTLIPAMAIVLLPAGTTVGRRRSPLAHWGGTASGWSVARWLRRPVWAYGLVVLLIAAGFAIVPQLGNHSMIPATQDRDLLVHWKAAEGTSLPEMDRITTSASDALRAVPGVIDVGAHVGRAINGDQEVTISSGEMWLSIAKAADYERTLARIRRVLDGYAGVRHDLVTYSADQLNIARATGARALTVRVSGQDFTTLGTQAEQVRQMLTGVKGVVAPRVDTRAEVPTIQIQVNLPAAEKYGLKPGDVRRAAATLINGLLVGNLYADQRIFDVVVVGTPALRQNLTTVQNLLIDTPAGGQVHLKDVASVQIQPSPPVIIHNEVSRTLDVTADVRGRDLGSVISDVRGRVQAMTFPLQYHADVFSDRIQQSDDNLAILAWALGAAIGIFLVLQAAFHSWSRAAVLFLTLPLSVTGGVLTAFLAGGLKSAGALLGLLPVLALALRAGITLIWRLQQLERDEGPPIERVARVARERALPVVLTAMATTLALAPFTLPGMAGEEILHPLAVVAIGGLVTSTLVTVFVLPALYLRFLSSSRPAGPSDTGVPVMSAPGEA